MNFARTNIVLGVLLVIAAAFAVAVDVDHTRPNLEFLPEMNRSAASDAYAANSIFANGRTLQAPVQGTIARGDLPLYYAATKEDAARAGEELQNPYALNDASGVTAVDQQTGQDEFAARLNASIKRGAQIYGVFCVSCHGPSGAGDGPVARRGFRHRHH